MTTPPLTKCLIANRGEIAVRVVRACQALGIRTVAVYSEADAGARHVTQADEAYAIGPASPAESYLNGDRLIAAALTAGCDCLHPGYGFLSESPDFAAAVLAAGLTWIGPGPDAIRRMGVKTEARALMAAAGVPLAPGFQSDSADEAAFLAAAGEIGYPVMVKAAGGGGGKGIRVVRDPADLPDALAAARREAGHAFGDPRLYLEKFVEPARHVEIQVLADQHGQTVHLFERDCSAQRRHQKVVEESPAPGLDEHTRQAMGAAAVQAAQAVGYVNAGTVEFILTPDGQFYFLEMNTRLQVEHPVTELVTGLDLVQLQFLIAAGQPLPFRQDDITRRGHALECRLYAEDAASGFLPSTGALLRFIPPDGPGLRVDSGVQTGDSIGIHYDPLIAKLIVHGQTRADAIARMQAALARTVVLGVATNRAFLQALLAHPAFAAGGIDTGFIEQHLAEFQPAAEPPSDLLLMSAALLDWYAKATPAVDGLSPVQADPWARADGFRMSG